MTVRLVIRPLRPRLPTWTPASPPDDVSFVAASWSASCGRAPEGTVLTPAAWRTAVWSSAPAIIARPGVHVLVAADAESAAGDADLFGWLCWLERPAALPVVFYTFVKRDARGNGIARQLFERANIGRHTAFPFVFETPDVAELRKAGKIPHATWQPLLGRFPVERKSHARPEAADDAA